MDKSTGSENQSQNHPLKGSNLGTNPRELASAPEAAPSLLVGINEDDSAHSVS